MAAQQNKLELTSEWFIARHAPELVSVETLAALNALLFSDKEHAQGQHKVDDKRSIIKQHLPHGVELHQTNHKGEIAGSAVKNVTGTCAGHQQQTLKLGREAGQR